MDMNNPSKTINRSSRGRLAAIAILGTTLGAFTASAGELQDIYDAAMGADLNVTVAEFHMKAAEQHVVTQKRGYMPRVSIRAREGWKRQDIQQTDTTIFREGRTDFENNRLNVEIDQPLYDPTVKANIEAAEARQRRVGSMNKLTLERQTRAIVEGFLHAVRYYALGQSNDRVIVRLEKELEKVTQSYDVKIATITDVQNIRLALASMRREKSNANQQLSYELSRIGVSSDVPQQNWANLTGDVDFTIFKGGAAVSPYENAEVESLRAEVDELGSLAAASQRRSWPSLSLYGQYSFDDADGSLFGGAREIEDLELGVAVTWNVFDRGQNRSRAKEYYFQKRAKEAELEARKTAREQQDTYSMELLSQSNRSVVELKDLMEQHKILVDAADRAYEEGKQTYIDSITAYLAYESSVREWEKARHEQLMRNVYFGAQTIGWSEELVQKLDSLFVSSN